MPQPVTSTFPASVDTFAFYNNAGFLSDNPTHGDRHDHLAAAIIAIETSLLNGQGGFEVIAHKGAAGGYAALDGTGKVPAAQLPSASGGGVSTLAATAGGHMVVSGTATAPTVGVDGVVELNTNKGVANGYAGLDSTGKLVPSQTYGVYIIQYNTTTNAWPARPSPAVVAAGQAEYRAAVASAADPTDTQIGDIVIIAASVAAPVFTASSPPGGVVSGTYSYTFVATNSPTSYAVASGAVPAGTSLNATTGVLSGTPTTAATYTFTVSATNAAGTATTGTLTVIISSTATTFALNNTVSNWDGTFGNATISSDAVNTHGGSSTIKATSTGSVGFVTIAATLAATAGTTYTIPTVFVRASTTNRKARVGFLWQDSSFATLRNDLDATDINLTSGAFVTGPTITATAPAGTARCVIQLILNSQDGSNIPSAETVNWSVT